MGERTPIDPSLLLVEKDLLLKAEAVLARLREAVELALKVRKDFQPEKAYGTSPQEAMEMVLRWALKGNWDKVDSARSLLSEQEREGTKFDRYRWERKRDRARKETDHTEEAKP